MRKKICKVAIAHDWLVAYAGAEIVLENILGLFEQLDLFCIIRDSKNPIFNCDSIANVYSSSLQKIPFIKKNYKFFASLMPRQVERFNFKKYDLVISSSWAFCHGLEQKATTTKHLAYVHTPMRWAWDMEKDYLSRERFVKFVQPLVRMQVRKLREWDMIAGQRPDKIIANSKFVKNRIKKYWSRDSEVIYPPVEIIKGGGNYESHGAFVSICRLVTYKRVDLIIRAFNKLPEKKLIIIGTGPELARLKMIAKKNILFIGRVTDQKKFDILRGAEGFIQASKEDFGISAVEAQACGIPVIAFGEGGALETVIDVQSNGNPTGVFFPKQSEDEIIKKIIEFSKLEFDRADCIKNAKKFSGENFRYKMLNQINSLIS